MARTQEHREELLKLFLQGYSEEKAAAALGISRRSVRRYSTAADFKSELAGLKMQEVAAALAKMQSALCDVVDTLTEIIRDRNVAPQIRANCSQILLSQARAWTETADIQQRLTEIEKTLAADEKAPGKGI